MTNTVTHFEIYGEHPVALVDFYRKAFGWQVEQLQGKNGGGDPWHTDGRLEAAVLAATPSSSAAVTNSPAKP